MERSRRTRRSRTHSPLTPLRRRARLAGSLGLLLLGGCGGCGSFVGNGLTCAGLKVVATPIMVADHIAQPFRDTRVKISPAELARRQDNYRRLQAGDPEAIAACAMHCWIYPAVTFEVEYAQELASSRKVIGWWGAHPEPEQLPVLVRSYELLAGELKTSDPAQAEAYLRQAALWLTDPRIEAGLTSPRYGANLEFGTTEPVAGQPYDRNYYNAFAQAVQSSLMLLRYRGRPGRAPDPSILTTHCQAIAAWPPAWMSAEQAATTLKGACAEAARIQQVAAPLPIDGLLDPEPMPSGGLNKTAPEAK